MEALTRIIALPIWLLVVSIIAGGIVGTLTLTAAIYVLAGKNVKQQELVPALEKAARNTHEAATKIKAIIPEKIDPAKVATPLPDYIKELNTGVTLRKMYSVDDAARMIGVEAETIMQRIRKGEVKFKLVKDKPYIEAQVLKGMLEGSNKA